MLGVRWSVLVVVAIGALAAIGCSRPSSTAPKSEAPGRIENTDVADVKRVILTQRAAERIGIATSPVVEQSIIRTRAIGGEVFTLESGGAVVRLRATPNDLSRVDRMLPARVQPLVARNSVPPGGLTFGPLAVVAPPIDPPAALVKDDPSPALFYSLSAGGHGFNTGDRVLIEVQLAGGAINRRVIPYSAVLHDVRGATWTYTQTAPLTYVRARVTLDYIDGDKAVLLDGPAAGTEVVSVAATELYGTEFKVGK